MLTHNADVESKLANGTCATVEQVIILPGESFMPIKLESGVKVKACFACQAEAVVLRHLKEDISPNLFTMKCETHSLTANWPMPAGLRTSNRQTEHMKMKLNQIPFVSNTAATGHKLQGKTVSAILAHELSCRFTNWVCVVLSRVTTMAGVYLRQALSEALGKHEVPLQLKEMLDRFRDREPICNSFEECNEAIDDNYIDMA